MLQLFCDHCGREYAPDEGLLPGDDCPSDDCPSHDAVEDDSQTQPTANEYPITH